MSYLKLSFSSISKNKLTFLLIIVEIAALFLTVNFLVSTLADRQMLTKGYEKILNDNTAVVWDSKFTENSINGLTNNLAQSREILLKDITDDYEIYDTIPITDIATDTVVFVVSDEIYNDLALPLVSGDYSEAVANYGYTDSEFSFNYNIDGKNYRNFNIKISGTLTADTYIPIMNYFSTGNDFTTKDLYENSNAYRKFIIARKSVFDGTDISANCTPVFMIHFSENFDENIAKLREKAGVHEGKAVLENSQSALLRDLADFIPIVICVLVVVIIGTMSISIILNKYNEKRGGVLWICGFSRRQILFAHFVNMLIIFIVAAILSVGAFFIMSLLQIELVVSANLSAANIIATITLSLILILASMIIPAIKSKNTSPVEYLRRAK